ncbi:glutathione synthetase-like [Bombus pascuorum]|uniref:glutathione synthetase-like n=1 Tax=Bombus pascuorum TaxID=65598 RepID=UPI00298E0D52|nr:glutathione synthetase-like [Bombus pascuorum]
MNYTIQRLVILTCRSNINFNIFRKINTVFTSYNHALTTRVFMTKFSLKLHHNNLLYTTKVQFEKDNSNLKLLTNKDANNYSSVQMKKRTKKRTAVSTNDETSTAYNVKALATSEEYNLEALAQGLIEEKLYEPSNIKTSTNWIAMDTELSLPSSKQELEELIEKAKDWALMHGMCMRSKQNFNENMLQFAPFILMPSPFPRKEFENACSIQIILNILIHRVAQDYNFLKATLEETIKVDNFTKKLFEICKIINREGGSAQKISLGILRSDLMLDTSCPQEDTNKKCIPYCCWKQVEINTIASGFGWLGPASTELHKFVLRELGYNKEIKNLPENNALEIICSSMIKAWKIYGNEQAVILFVVEDVTYNICDQRFHEFEIKKQNPNVRVIRRNLTQLAATAKLGSNKELIVDNYIISVVYYRCGYEPGQYHTQKEWDVRLLIERSLAIKCPTIQYHLAGTKKVQQALAKPDAISRFLKNKKTCAEIKKIFTEHYALDFDKHGDAAIEMGITNPHCFVLKPQREGGCNNKYGLDIKYFLESVKNKQDRVAWILMDKIHPPIHKSHMIRPENNMSTESQELVSELGIFGVIIADENNVYLNKQSGHMLRTKLATANEGGVASGLGACDSPFLIN